MALQNPHDLFVRGSLSRIDLAQDFFARYLPTEVQTTLNMATLALTKDSFVDDDLSTQYSDMLYTVDTKNGQLAYLYVLLEHKSWVSDWTGLQLLGYMVRIWEQERQQRSKPPLPAIIPLLLYHGEKAWTAATEFSVLIDAPEALLRYIPRFTYQRCDLNQDQLDQLQGQALLAVLLQVLKYGRSSDLPERLLGILRLFRDLLSQRDDALGYLETVLRYLAQISGELNESNLQAALHQALPTEIGDQLMPTLAETWHERGREEGREEGFLQGERRTYVRLAHAKFGAETADALVVLLKRINDSEKLTHISNWILQCESGEDLLARVQGLSEPH